MMELRDFTIPRAKVKLPGKAKPGADHFFEVRGLSTDDLTYLVATHHADITKALVLYREQSDSVVRGGAQAFSGFILMLLRDFPDMMTEVISAATDALDDKTRGVAKKLPFTTQLAALNEIVKLSMEDIGELKNLLAELRNHASASAGAK